MVESVDTPDLKSCGQQWPPQGDAPPPPPISQEASQFFSRILDKLPLKGVDTADILLLLILFFLFEEKADDELLVALGLLLIL